MKIKVAAVAIATTGLFVLAGCSATGSSSGGSSGSSTSPIVVGSVNALSGPATFPEASQAAQAVFNQVNQDGGIGGRKIEYKILDDKADPATGAADAREIVASDKAVALVGSASLIDCQVNGQYYQQSGILSIQGTGVDQDCFQNPNISAVNVGPYGDTTMTLTYGSQVLGLKKICAFLEITGNTLPSYKAAIAAWSTSTGKQLAMEDDTVPYGASDYTPYIVKAKAAGCDAVYANAVQPDAIGQMKAAAAQGWNNVTFLYLTSVYSTQFATAATQVGKGVYVPAEFAPYTDANSSKNADWQKLMTADKIPLTSFAQGGYLAATYFVQVLKSIKGDITRDSVTKALRDMQPISNPMVGTPWTFGTAATHNSNRTGWPIKLLPGTGKWALAASDWFKLDK
jgi:branched-chain amino acid transport system substrate-binding protein